MERKIKEFLVSSSAVIIYDSLIAALSFIFALHLRLGIAFTDDKSLLILGSISISVITFICFSIFQVHKIIWRYVSLSDLLKIVKAITLTVLIFLLFIYMINDVKAFPRTVFIINWMIMIIIIPGIRLLYRATQERSLKLSFIKDDISSKIPILLIGVNNRTESFIDENNAKKDTPYLIVGVIDNIEARTGSYINNTKIIGTVDNIKSVLDNLAGNNIFIKEVMLTDEKYSGSFIRNLMELLDIYNVYLSKITSLGGVEDNKSQLLKAKPVNIDDLFSHPVDFIDDEKVQDNFAGNHVMIIGGAGNIGKELVMQIGRFKPALMTVVELNEQNLYMLETFLNQEFPDMPLSLHLADIRDYHDIEGIFDIENPDIVIHTATLKRVHLSEQNPLHTISTNIFGTRNIVKLCIRNKVKQLIYTSSDKAVNPSNILGATIRVAENLLHFYAQKAESHLKIAVIRFGNLVDSSCSVFSIFDNQIKNGGPITITHPDMVRYFITSEDISKVILKASSLKTMSSYALYVVDMGEPVRILDLATKMIQLSGLKPGKDIQIQFIGFRKGEKLFEELFYFNENPIQTECQAIMQATPKYLDVQKFEKYIKELEEDLFNFRSSKCLEIVKQLVPEYENNF